MRSFDIVVAGGGPGGLAAAHAAAEQGARVLLLEQADEIGAPTRTTGGSFVKDLEQLGIPRELYHTIRTCRFISPGNAVQFTYDEPVTCVMDVRRVFQFLGEKATAAGAMIQLASTATDPIIENGAVRGVTIRSKVYGEETVRSSILIDATGYRSALLKKAGVHAGFRRFGVGSEFDFYAPEFDQSEAVLIVGSQVAPAGYAWAFPWGRGRVRLGVGIIHTDSDAHPDIYLKKLVDNADRFGMNFRGAQPIEYHYGLIPSEGILKDFIGDGVLGVGDAAGQASALAGEGIRWAIKAGRMAGSVSAEAVAAGDASVNYLRKYQKQWRSAYGINLRIAYEINKKISRWDDSKWDRKFDLLKLFTPAQFAEALQANFVAGWAFRLLWSHPRVMKETLKGVLEKEPSLTGPQRPQN
jgi:digeranylgeranylglycerophospholipid reductase